MNSLAQRIHAALPQTQCTRCGFPDCAAYANAIADAAAPINQCPPGGAEGIARLAAITGQEVQPLSPEHGNEGPRKMVFIDESWCIGCTLCLKVCPTDAIFGSNKKMHTVLEAYCTGCELCLPVCPVDCIETEPVDRKMTGWAAWPQALADQAAQRYAQRSTRLARQALLAAPPVAGADAASDPVQTGESTAQEEQQRRRSVIEAALARAREKGSR